ncbi:NAD(P)/FAD-dependent oxidoreductase [Crenothrix polyspora]|uniref:Rubredoxin--NAD(+) reductase n=1 Tax=Crenothrix polyspora TaxID=360316 RepID=A0A1R4H9X8_9GAMM|nr:FAD-dependent oxidoreductase [Crenothrix polyspora]SJM93064.1 Rubredoxin--NAD(+) reductase [Crenothrix polyspora]
MHIVIIGSGIAGVSFAEKCLALKASTPNSTIAINITLVTHEHDGYYSRPLLSRGFTKTDIENTIILKKFDKIRDSGINVLSGAEVTAIDRHSKTIALDSVQERTLHYDILVLAQGSEAFIPPPYQPFKKLFFCLNSLVDLKAIRAFRHTLVNQNRKPHWAIIGGGLIGCELASDLAVAGDNVTVFHAVERLMERQLVVEDSALLLNVLHKSGVTVLFNQNIQAISQQAEKVAIQTDVFTEFDGLIVACGFKPRTDLAKQAGLNVGRGIKVNTFLQTNDDSIFALGDCAELPNGKLYAYILPIRSQATWLASFILQQEHTPWTAPVFTSKAKVHGFEAVYPYNV